MQVREHRRGPELQPRAREQRDVRRAEGLAIVVVRERRAVDAVDREGSVLAIEARGDVVDHGLPAAIHVRRVVGVIARFEEIVDVVRLEHLERRDRPAVDCAQPVRDSDRRPAGCRLRGRRPGERRGVSDARREVGVAREAGKRLVRAPRRAREALIHPEAELRRPRRALLGEDLNHARVRLAAVQRGGRGALEDLDPLDRLWIDVVQPRRRTAAPGARVRKPAAIVHAHPVQVHDGLVVLAQAGVATDADAGPFAHEAGGREHLHPRLARRDRLRKGLNRRVLDRS